MEPEHRSEAPATASWMFWAVAVLSLIWNGFGAYDFVMINLRDPQYIAKYPPAVIQMLDAFPVWVTAAWALGVWGALAGSVLLVLRSRNAVLAFGLSLLGLAARTFYEFGLDLPDTARVSGMNAMTLMIWIVAALLLIYSIRWRSAGVLR